MMRGLAVLFITLQKGQSNRRSHLPATLRGRFIRWWDLRLDWCFLFSELANSAS